MGKIKILLKKKNDKKPVYGNKSVSAKENGTKFEHRILKDNKHYSISIEQKNGSRYEYLSIIFLDSILDSSCSNKYYPQTFFKKCIYTKDKEGGLLGKYIY